MKKFRQTAALCVSMLLAAAAIPAFAVQAEPDTAAETTEAAAGLPASYDLRSKGLVTEVGDEMQYNTSWAFAAANSMESGLIAADPLVNLSEWDMAYYMFSDLFGYKYETDAPFNEEIVDTEQIGGFLTSWLGPIREEIGYSYGDMTIMNSEIPAEMLRSNASFHVKDVVSYLYQPTDQEGELQPDVLNPQIQKLKERIYSGHALSMRVVYANTCYHEDTFAYYYNYNDVAGTAEEETMNWRYLSIVGWDDAFPASSFKSDPGMDGAWLCKDCRGTAFGDDGYIWVSYADCTIDGVSELRMETAELNNRLYQHDEYGCSGNYCIDKENGDKEVMIANVFTAENNGWITGVMFYNQYSGDTFETTIYTGLTSKDNPVSGTASPAKSVVLDETGYLTIELDKPIFLKKGEMFSVTAKVSGSEAGTRIPCEYTSRLTRTKADGIAEVYDSTFTREMMERTFETGQSFYSTDGTAWVDMYNVEPEKWKAAIGDAVSTEETEDNQPAISTENQVLAEEGEEAIPEDISTINNDYEYDQETRYGNISLKAVTRNSGTVVFSNYTSRLKEGETIRLSSDDNAPIYYTLNGIEWTLYDDENPIAMPEGEKTMTLSAYADLSVVSLGEEKRLYTQTYTREAADVSSILCKSDKDPVAQYANRETMTPGADFVFYVPKDATSLEMTPISTGSVKINDTACESGKTIDVPLAEGKNTVQVTVTEEGKEAKTFAVKVERLADAGISEATDPALLDPDAERELGDVNGDKQMDAKDAAMILAASVRVTDTNPTGGLTEAQQKAADVNNDGAFDAKDAALLLRYSVASSSKDIKFEDFIAPYRA